MIVIPRKNKQFKWPVTISEPQDGGTVKNTKITVTFKPLSKTEIQEAMRMEAESGHDYLDEVLLGWDDQAFAADDGSSFIYSDENKKVLLEFPFIRNALTREYFNAINGNAFQRKN